MKPEIKLEWKDFVDKELIPKRGVVLAQVADNVLSEKDWPVLALLMDDSLDKDGIVIGMMQVKDGVYSPPNFPIGTTRDELAAWTRHDDTGKHPEIWHRLLVVVEPRQVWYTLTVCTQ